MRMVVVIGKTFWAALVAWWDDDALRMGASIAYYSLFAIAPVLLVAIAVAGFFFGEEAVRGQVAGQLEGLVGPNAAAGVEALLRGTATSRSSSLALVTAGVTFVVGATGAFLELRFALNTILRAPPSTGISIRGFFVNRLRAFGIIVAIGFLLLISLVVSAALAAIHTWLSSYALALPAVLEITNLALSLLVTATLFGLMFRVLPDVRLRSSDIAVGAVVTAVLFTIGKQLIGLYLGRSAMASSYGAGGSVIVLLLWVYYSSQALLIGAEFTRLYAMRERPEGPA